jgi:hypothetical protein
MNSVYADTNIGATTFTNASFGYGQLPALTPVTVGGTILASQWDALFQTIRKAGTHQGTTVVPPLPVSDPIPGGAIIAYNTPPLATTIASLTSNRFNIALGQYALVNAIGSPFTAPTWTHTLTYTFTANFGTWDGARHFFNTGGAIYISGAHPAGSGDDAEWHGMLLSMSPLVFNYGATTPNIGTPGPIGGFWNIVTAPFINPLTASYQTVYTQTYLISPYSGSYIQVNARLGAAAGTAGSEVITFQVVLFQADSGTLFQPKVGTTMTPGYRYSSGATPTSQPILTSLGFVAT